MALIVIAASVRQERGEEHHGNESEHQGLRVHPLISERAQVGTHSSGRGERKGHSPAETTIEGLRACTERGGERNNDQRRRRGWTDPLVQDIHQNGQGEDRAPSTDRAHHGTYGQTEGDGKK